MMDTVPPGVVTAFLRPGLTKLRPFGVQACEECKRVFRTSPLFRPELTKLRPSGVHIHSYRVGRYVYMTENSPNMAKLKAIRGREQGLYDAKITTYGYCTAKRNEVTLQLGKAQAGRFLKTIYSQHKTREKQ